MRVTSSRLPLALLLAASAFALGGCSPEAAVPSAPPSAEAEPLFASDEEALAAAEAAYAEYLAVSNEILESGGVGEEELRPLVSDQVFEDESASYAERRAKNWRSVGSTELVSTKLQQSSETASGAEVIAFVCVSYLDVDVVGPDDVSVVNPDRPPYVTFEAVVSFDSEGKWRLERNEFWEASESCE